MPRPPTNSKLESLLESFFVRRVRELGGICIKITPTQAGVPDRLVLLPNSKMYLVELKSDDGALSAIQKHQHSKINELGIHVYVLFGRTDVNKWLLSVTDPANTAPWDPLLD